MCTENTDHFYIAGIHSNCVCVFFVVHIGKKKRDKGLEKCVQNIYLYKYCIYYSVLYIVLVDTIDHSIVTFAVTLKKRRQ